MKVVMITFAAYTLLLASAALAEPTTSSNLSYYGVTLGAEKAKLDAELSKLSIHHLDRTEHAKVLQQNKLASVIFQYKDVCADDPKDLGKGYELVICTFTSEKAKAKKIKGIALVFAGSKLFRIEVSLDGKTTKELDELMKGAAPREKDKLNEIGKKNLLFSFFPFLYSQRTDPTGQRIFQKGQQIFSIVNESPLTYVVLLEPTILFEHQNKK